MSAITRISIVSALLIATAVVNAHHSYVWFDRSKTATLTGTVRTLQWTNPHVWLWLEVPDATGASTTWGLEGPSPVNLTRMGSKGWSSSVLSKGDRITVVFNPARSGKSGGSLVSLQLSDGTLMKVTPDALIDRVKAAAGPDANPGLR